MKRTVGTLVLFILLVITVALLTQLDGKSTTALKSNAPADNAAQ